MRYISQTAFIRPQQLKRKHRFIYLPGSGQGEDDKPETLVLEPHILRVLTHFTDIIVQQIPRQARRILAGKRLSQHWIHKRFSWINYAYSSMNAVCAFGNSLMDAHFYFKRNQSANIVLVNWNDHLLWRCFDTLTRLDSRRSTYSRWFIQSTINW